MRISDWSSDVCSSDLYSFYTAWHLTVLEFGISIARVALCRDAVTGSLRPPSVDVVAAAKRPLRRGETLDGIGGDRSGGAGVGKEVLGRVDIGCCRYHLKKTIEVEAHIKYFDHTRHYTIIVYAIPQYYRLHSPYPDT